MIEKIKIRIDKEINNEKYNNKRKIFDKNENEEFSIRSINLKLDPSLKYAELLDNDFYKYSYLHDIGVNRYARLPDASKDAISEEAKKMRKEYKSPDCTGTFVDLAVGSNGADSYFRTIRKMAKRDILRRDEEIKKIEKDNVNLIKLKSVWFDSIKINKIIGNCSMCGRNGFLFWKSNEYDEYLCEVCIVDFFAYREPLVPINRHIQKNYFLCKDLLSSKIKLSEGLVKEINRQSENVRSQSFIFKNTISNKIKLKGGQLKIDFDNTTVLITLSNGEKIQIPFSGDYYYSNYPKYGKNSDEYKFRKLIQDFVDGRGYASLIRKYKNGKKEYYLSVPTHYPMIDKRGQFELIEGCILIAQRKVLIYINGIAKFVELFNPYNKKRIYETRNKDIQKRNADLCICDWNRIPKKNKMLLRNLKKKLGFDWINEYNVRVNKDDDNKVVINNYNDDKRIEITIDRNAGTGELKSIDNGHSYSQKLYIIEKKNDTDIDIDYNKYRKTDIYIEPQIAMPKKYSGGNLLKHIRHKNKETARYIVEEAKKLLSENGTVLLIDYRGMHAEGECVVPISALNDQILNMLKYDSIYAGSIRWGRLKNLSCPNCHRIIPEKGEDGKRFIIRDIFLSEIKRWICEEENCNERINSPLIAVGRYIMQSDLKELLKKPTRKETFND